MKSYNELTHEILEFMFDHAADDLYINECKCGAFTISGISTKEEIAFSGDTQDECVPFLRADTMTDNCNHCVNNWGIDIEDEEEEDLEMREGIQEFTCFYGSSGLPITVWSWKDDNSGLTWYALHDSENVNATTDEVFRGCDVEELNDVDTFGADAAILDDEDFNRELHDYLD